MADSESPQVLYAKNLRQTFGYPLRFPEPGLNLPSSYADHGLHIGDVGYVDEDGMFKVQFNICFSPDHELHQARRNGLAGLVGLTKYDENEVSSTPNAFPPGGVVCHGIQSSPADDLKYTQRFTSRSASGAILILPSGAERQKLENKQEEEFRKLAEKYALDWCRFTGFTSLYLITGFYRTNSWYLAAFHDVERGQVISICDNAGRYTWYNCAHRESLRENRKNNQTVLITGFKIKVRWDERVLVKKISPRSRSIWSRMKGLSSHLLCILPSLQRMATRSLCKLHGASVDINRVPALSPPFHPSDIINNYLLSKKPHVSVAITHDNAWLSMIKNEGLSHEDMVDEERFRAFLENNYTDDPNSDNVAYLLRKIDGSDHNGDEDPHNSSYTPEKFAIPTLSDDIRWFIITRMRVENVVICLKRMPIGFYVLVQFNNTERRSRCKPPFLLHPNIEWDDKVVLPADLTVEVQFSIIASFEFQPILGSGETLCTFKRSVGELVEGGGTNFPWGEQTSLFITCEEWRVDIPADWSRDNMNLGCKDGLYFQITKETDEGHNALLCYYRGEGLERLKECVAHYKLALDLCQPEHECCAIALFNYARAMFISCRVYGTISDLDVAIDSYRKALERRLDPHQDRPQTLLHLAQALLYSQGRLQRAPSVAGEIERHSTEIKQICSENRYEYQAANLVIETLKQNWVLLSGSLAEIDELIQELDRSVEMTPEWHFDRPHRSINLSVALRKRFDITDDLNCLTRSISVMKEVTVPVSDSYFDEPWALTFLGDALYARSIRCNDVADLDDSIPKIEAAAKLTHDGHFDKPWILSSLGDALRARFTRGGDLADLDNSISIIEAAVKLASDAHVGKPWILTRLGVALLLIHIDPQASPDQLDNLANLTIDDLRDLEQAILRHRNALDLLLDGNPHKSICLTNLASSLLVRFWCLHYPSDLEEAVSTYKDAIDLIPNDHPGKPKFLNNLALSLAARFERLLELGDLDDAISRYKDAVRLTPDNRLEKSSYLNNLVNCVSTRFEHSRELRDLEEAVSRHRM